ncbi:MAG: hypothetical protein D3906_15270 [Candidatus Electrothrix sp. AUS1_2]|nr:hypothetical protein [Candidatus Electrothrix sp. AUS1_2]
MPTTVTLEYGTVAKLTAYLAESLLGMKAAVAAEKEKTKTTIEEEVELLTQDELDSSIEQELEQLDSFL